MHATCLRAPTICFSNTCQANLGTRSIENDYYYPKYVYCVSCINLQVSLTKMQYFKLYGISKFEMFSGGSRDISGVAAPTLTKESSVNRGDVIGLLMSGIYTR